MQFHAIKLSAILIIVVVKRAKYCEVLLSGEKFNIMPVEENFNSKSNSCYEKSFLNGGVSYTRFTVTELLFFFFFWKQ